MITANNGYKNIYNWRETMSYPFKAAKGRVFVFNLSWYLIDSLHDLHPIFYGWSEAPWDINIITDTNIITGINIITAVL